MIRINEELKFSINREMQALRFRELILYVCKKFENAEYFGAVKLNKVLYHCDFRTFDILGAPITGMKYFKLQNGPAPKALVPVRRQMTRDGLISETKREMPDGSSQKRLIAQRNADSSIFSRAELDIVDQVVAELFSQTAQEVSNASHDLRWKVVQLEDTIPYDFVNLSNDEAASDELIARTKELFSEHGWT